MPIGRCEWCNRYHDIPDERCREIQRVTRQLEAENPLRREARLQRRLDELKRPRMIQG